MKLRSEQLSNLMDRRRFLQASIATGLTIGLAGCNSDGDNQSTSPQTERTTENTEPDAGTGTGTETDTTVEGTTAGRVPTDHMKETTAAKDTTVAPTGEPTETANPTDKETAIPVPTETSTGTPTTSQTPTETPTASPTQTEPEEAYEFFFEDETGALGELADDEIPENTGNLITNNLTEEEYSEIQRNDRMHAEDVASARSSPQPLGMEMTVDEVIQRTEEIYENPKDNFATYRVEFSNIDFDETDDQLTFIRSLIKASNEAGLNSSGAANDFINNVVEDALQQIEPGFDLKLSTLIATEPADPGGTGIGGGEKTNQSGDSYINSGLRHSIGLLQYETEDGAKVKYCELTDSVNVRIFSKVIRNPEDSLYRSSLEQETVSARPPHLQDEYRELYFPEHYVTSFDYTKARELESQNILGMANTSRGDGEINGLGDYIGVDLMEIVEDMGITGYDDNPDRSVNYNSFPNFTCLVSDEFGESLEDYITDPDEETRQRVEEVGRGLYQIMEDRGYNQPVALTGNLENPRFFETDVDTTNQIRQDEAYGEVTQRVRE